MKETLTKLIQIYQIKINNFNLIINKLIKFKIIFIQKLNIRMNNRKVKNI